MKLCKFVLGDILKMKKRRGAKALVMEIRNGCYRLRFISGEMNGFSLLIPFVNENQFSIVGNVFDGRNE